MLCTSSGASKQVKRQWRQLGDIDRYILRSSTNVTWRKPNRTAHPTVSISHGLRKHSRCVSLWKRATEAEKPQEPTEVENEISITPAEVDKIFGRKMDPDKGVEILLTLQKHRLKGTLDHKLPFSNTLRDRGLTYLRTVNPVDEDAAIVARIDRETFRQPQTNVERSPQATSQFEKFKEYNKKQNKLWDAEREAEEKERAKKVSNETSKTVEPRSKKTTAPSNDLVQLRPEPEWVRNYREKATNRDYDKTMMSVWRRLMPSAGVTIAVIALSILFAQNYTPPSQNARLWPDIPPAAATVLSIIGLNCLVFVLWRIPPMWKFMNKNFLVAPVYPYSMSMLGASFSHQSFSHLLANAFVLWLAGTRVHDDIGRGPFLALYFSFAVIAAYVPMAVYVLRNELTATTLGASGVACGLLGTFCVLHEGTTITFPVLPQEWTRVIDTGMILGLCILLELWHIRKWGLTPSMEVIAKSGREPIDRMGHLTGYVAGAGAGAVIRAKDSKWRDTERHHSYTRNTRNIKRPTASVSPPAE